MNTVNLLTRNSHTSEQILHHPVLERDPGELIVLNSLEKKATSKQLSVSKTFLSASLSKINFLRSNDAKQVAQITGDSLDICESFFLHQKIQAFCQKYFQIILKLSDPLKKVVGVKQIIEIARVPSHFLDVFKSGLDFVRGGKEKKFEASLNIINRVREVGTTISTFVLGLRELGMVASDKLLWMQPFAVVMSFLSLASITSNLKTCMKMRRLLQEMDFAVSRSTKVGVDLSSYRSVMNLFEQEQKKDPDFFQNTFNADAEKLAEAFFSLEVEMKEKLSSEDVDIRKEGVKAIEETLKILRGRIHKNIVSSAISTTVSAINLIGTIVLLACPAFPAGWAIMGVGSLLDFSSWTYHKVVEYKFASHIGLKRTKLEWLTC